MAATEPDEMTARQPTYIPVGKELLDDQSLTDEHVAGTLRQAVRTGIVVGWKPQSDGTWLINPQIGRCVAKTPWEVREYCASLNRSGILP